MRKCKSFFKPVLVWALVVATTMSMTMPSKGWAMLAPADGAAAMADGANTRAQDAQAVQTALETEMIRERLADFNLTPEQVNERLSQLSDEEVHQVAQQVEAISPGGDAVGVLLIVALVLLIIYLFRRV